MTTFAAYRAACNYADAEFLCTDINHYDMRRLPHTEVLWASVICTELSPAGGNRKLRGQGALDLEEYGHVPSDSYERTRACALDVIRATEVHRYAAVVVENVVEFARDWELYDWWVEGMCKLGYNVEVVNVSAAHIYGDGNAPAPQWRDRIYILFTRKGVPRPDLVPRPPSWCFECGALVEGRQTWKRVDRRQVGKYGQQYVYRCPNVACGHSIVEPLVLPAVAALDLSDLGERIGDRAKPLAARTMARIEYGVVEFAQPVIVAATGNTFERDGYKRAWPANEAPLTTRQATGCDALAWPPIMVNAAAGRHHALTTPPAGAFVVRNYGGNARPEHLARPVGEPLGPITTKDHHALVIPYRRAAKPRRADDEPLPTISTIESAGVLRLADIIADCHYRMLKPREHLRGQRFTDDYVVTGNLGEQTMQAGNAVPCNVAQWIGSKLYEVLNQ